MTMLHIFLCYFRTPDVQVSTTIVSCKLTGRWWVQVVGADECTKATAIIVKCFSTWIVETMNNKSPEKKRKDNALRHTLGDP